MPAAKELERVDALDEREAIDVEQRVGNWIKPRQEDDFAAGVAHDRTRLAVLPSLWIVVRRSIDSVEDHEVVGVAEVAVFEHDVMDGRAESIDRVLRGAGRVAFDPDDRDDDELAPRVARFRDEQRRAAIEDTREIVECAAWNIEQHIVRGAIKRLEPLALGLGIPDVFDTRPDLRITIGIEQREAAG